MAGQEWWDPAQEKKGGPMKVKIHFLHCGCGLSAIGSIINIYQANSLVVIRANDIFSGGSSPAGCSSQERPLPHRPPGRLHLAITMKNRFSLQRQRLEDDTDISRTSWGRWMNRREGSRTLLWATRLLDHRWSLGILPGSTLGVWRKKRDKATISVDIFSAGWWRWHRHMDRVGPRRSVRLKIRCFPPSLSLTVLFSSFFVSYCFVFLNFF